MAFQPYDDKSDPHNALEYTVLKSFDFSNNPISNPEKKVNFSSVTNVEDAPSSSTTVPNVIENDPSNTSVEYDKFDELMDDCMKSDFGSMFMEDQLDFLTKELDKQELNHTNNSIKDRTMSVETEPPTDIRRRYESDGKRQIEKSRSKPMAIKLPDLKTCELKSNQSFWLQLDLITTKENPLKKEYIHPYKLEYHEDGLPEFDNGIIRIPLSPTDIQKGIKQLARIAIIKVKLDAYTFKFIPFNPLPTDNAIDIYEDDDAKTDAAKAKHCRDLYHFESSHIACKLLIKQNDTWLLTDIQCKTKVMEEKKQSNKRSASLDIHDNDQTYHPNPPKIAKRCSSAAKRLPITRVKKSTS